jgi:hypothetical protein
VKQVKQMGHNVAAANVHRKVQNKSKTGKSDYYTKLRT